MSIYHAGNTDFSAHNEEDQEGMFMGFLRRKVLDAVISPCQKPVEDLSHVGSCRLSSWGLSVNEKFPNKLGICDDHSASVARKETSQP